MYPSGNNLQLKFLNAVFKIPMMDSLSLNYVHFNSHIYTYVCKHIYKSEYTYTYHNKSMMYTYIYI